MWLADQNIANDYSSTVDRCLVDPHYFNNFKSIRAYGEIVSQHPPYGPTYYERIMNEAPKELCLKLPEISKCDTIGNPVLNHYVDKAFFPNDLKISACNLRYVNTVMEINRHFDFGTESINVVELGVGFGGLCFAASKWFNINSYCLIDLENVQALATKCLDQLGSTNHTTNIPDKIDLFISEFCLSEFTDELIDSYYQKCLVKADKIFLRFNLHDEQRKAAFLEKLGKDFNYTLEDEWPKTHWPNYVIIGTKK